MERVRYSASPAYMRVVGRLFCGVGAPAIGLLQGHLAELLRRCGGGIPILQHTDARAVCWSVGLRGVSHSPECLRQALSLDRCSSALGRFVREDNRAGRGEHAADAVADGDLGARHLGRG